MTDLGLNDSAEGGYQHHVDPKPIPSSVFSGPNWMQSQISAKLGLPLKLAVWPKSNHQCFNYGLQVLLLEVSPDDAEFGTSAFDPLLGDVLVMRVDGKDLDARHLDAVQVYISEECKEVMQFQNMPHIDRRADARRIAGEKLAIEPFKRFWRRHRVARAAEGHDGWEDAVCPV